MNMIAAVSRLHIMRNQLIRRQLHSVVVNSEISLVYIHRSQPRNHRWQPKLPQQLQQQMRSFAIADPDAPKKKTQKVKKKEKNKSDKEDSENQKLINQMYSCLDAPQRKEGPISPEEKERRSIIGRNHVIGRFKQHNEINHDITCKIHMKQHAIKMLPPGPLKDHAMETNDEYPPEDRIIAGLQELEESMNSTDSLKE